MVTECDGVRARSVPAESTVRECARKKRNRNEVCEEEEKEADGLFLYAGVSAAVTRIDCGQLLRNVGRNGRISGHTI